MVLFIRIIIMLIFKLITIVKALIIYRHLLISDFLVFFSTNVINIFRFAKKISEKTMSLFGKNIRKIRLVKKLSQSALADLVNIKRANIGAYEEERAEPKIDFVIRVANHFSISIDALLTKELTVNMILGFDVFRHEAKKKTISSVPFVSAQMLSAYCQQHNSRQFIESLPTVGLVEKTEKSKCAFELCGNELTKGDVRVQHGDILYCIKIKTQKQIVFPALIVAVLEKKVEFLACRSTVDLQFIHKHKELWLVNSFYSSNPQDASQLSQRVFNIEQQIENLKK